MKLAGFFDIETTNTATGAFMCAAAFLPMRGLPLIVRTPEELVAELLTSAADVAAEGDTAVFAAYNLGFDVYPLRPILEKRGLVEAALKQHDGSFYLIDWQDAAGETLFRMWDMRHVYPGGLAGMGKAIGRRKLEGEWDYNKDRSQETPLTPQETAYLCEDVEILRKFARWLPQAFPWIKAEDLGRTVITQGSIARTYQRRVIGKVRAGRDKLAEEFLTASAATNRANDRQEELRRDAYAGGFTFVQPAYCWKTLENVSHFDIDSAYHWSLMHVPLVGRWNEITAPWLVESIGSRIAERAGQLATLTRQGHLTADDLLNPFGIRFHARIKISGLRAVDETRPAPVAAARLSKAALAVIDAGRVVSGKAKAYKAREEMGRLLAAEVYTAAVDEYELATLAATYEWDALEFLELETGKVQSEHGSLFLRMCSLALRAEKERRKRDGGPRYALFKGVYNAQAGLYAQSRGKAQHYTIRNLPLAVRVTSLTRFIMTLATVWTPQHALVSGDTDSLKIWTPVGVAQRPCAEGIEKINALIREATNDVTPLEKFIADANGISIPETLGTLGQFIAEDHAPYHRELAPKQRAWISKDGHVRMVYAGARSDGIVEVLEHIAKKQGKVAALEALQPLTWVPRSVAKQVVPARVQAEGWTHFTGHDANGEFYSVYTTAARKLEDRMICIGGIPTEKHLEKLRLSGVENPTEAEGILTIKGRWTL